MANTTVITPTQGAQLTQGGGFQPRHQYVPRLRSDNSPGGSSFRPRYHKFQPRFPPNFTVADDGTISYDGKRMRKAIHRKTVDYNPSVFKYLQSRVWQRDRRDEHQIQPDSLYSVDLKPPGAFLERPMNCVTTKFVRTSTNKFRCPVFCLSWTPEGRRLVTGASSGEFTLWNGLTFNFETILQAHETAVRAMQWSHSDTWMITADHAGYIKYWQSNMNNVKMYQAHKEPIRGISFCPSDTKFASCSDDGSVRVWDFMKCHEERVLRGHGADVRCVDWHPQKGLLASGSKDNQQPIKLWDPRTGQSLATMHAHKHTVMDLKWHQNGTWMLTASRDHLVKLFDIRKMKEELQTFKGHKREATSIAWHPVHEGLFASGSADGSLMFWMVGCDHEVGSMEEAHEGMIWDLAWHPLGHILASGSNDHSTKFWTRNRPGDEMRDKYNLNNLPQGMMETEMLEYSGLEPSAMPSLPGMGLDQNLPEHLVKQEPETKKDGDGLSAIPGLDWEADEAFLRAEERAAHKKVPYSRPVPKVFEQAWSGEIDLEALKQEQKNKEEIQKKIHAQMSMKKNQPNKNFILAAQQMLGALAGSIRQQLSTGEAPRMVIPGAPVMMRPQGPRVIMAPGQRMIRPQQQQQQQGQMVFVPGGPRPVGSNGEADDDMAEEADDDNNDNSSDVCQPSDEGQGRLLGPARPQGAMGGPQNQMGPQGDPQNQMGGPPNQMGPRGIPPNQMGPRGPQNHMGPRGGPQNQMHPQNQMGPQGGPQNQMGPRGGPQNQMGPQGGPQNQMNPQGGPQMQMSGPQNQMGHPGGPQFQMGGSGGPNRQMGGFQMGGPKNQMGGQLNQMGGPQNQMGGPQNQMGGPQNQMGGPQNQMGGPQNQMGGPQNQMGGPQNQMGGPQNQMGGPQNQMGGPQNQMGGPQNQMGGPQNQMGGPQNQVGGPQNQMGGPQNQMGGPQNQMGGPQNRMGGPQDQMGGPQNQMGGPQNQMGGPQNQMGGPQNQMGGPQNQMGGPQNQMGGPQNQMGGPQNMMGGPQNQMGGPQNMMGGPQNMMGGQQNQQNMSHHGQFQHPFQHSGGGPQQQHHGGDQWDEMGESQMQRGFDQGHGGMRNLRQHGRNPMGGGGPEDGHGGIDKDERMPPQRNVPYQRQRQLGNMEDGMDEDFRGGGGYDQGMPPQSMGDNDSMEDQDFRHLGGGHRSGGLRQQQQRRGEESFLDMGEPNLDGYQRCHDGGEDEDYTSNARYLNNNRRGGGGGSSRGKMDAYGGDRGGYDEERDDEEDYGRGYDQESGGSKRGGRNRSRNEGQGGSRGKGRGRGGRGSFRGGNRGGGGGKGWGRGGGEKGGRKGRGGY